MWLYRGRVWCSYRLIWITEFMWSELHMPFKNGISSSNKIEVKRLHELKILFSIMLTKQLKKINCIINVDESSFSRFMKKDYTWPYRRIPESLKNIQLNGYLNHVFTICSTGVSYSTIVKKTMNSDNLIHLKMNILVTSRWCHFARNSFSFRARRKV